MSFKREDVITFDDNQKVLVLESLLYQDNEYLFVNEILPDESDMTDEYRILVANYSDGTLEGVSDPDILNAIIPMFQEKLKEYE